MSITDLPHVNASLNALSAILIGCGFVLIRRGRWQAHAVAMISATATSTAFLVCYLIYHAHVGSKSFRPDLGLIRTVYLALLASHTVLAAGVVPLVILALYRAIRRQWSRHRRIARWTFWVWMYVSVTGVMIYLALYQIWKV